VEAIGKNDQRLVAQRQRFDSYLDKAAAKEDFQELEREKKRVRFEPSDSEGEPIGRAKKVETGGEPAAASSSSSSSSSGLRRKPQEGEGPEREVRAKVREKRGEKRALDDEDLNVEPENENRGEKRALDDEDPNVGPEKTMKIDAIDRAEAHATKTTLQATR